MKAARLQRIRELLEGREFVDIESLSRELGTSDSSVRRDLAVLESEGVVRRVHGGAIATQPRDHLLDFAWQRTRNAEAKRRIAEMTAALLEDGMTLLFDGGSTTAAVASQIVNRSFHVITNSLAIAEIFKNSRQVEVTLTGGYLFPRLEVMLGPVCEHSLSGVRADLLIMGTGGITMSGLSNNNTLLVGSERKMMEVSNRVLIVADASKFGREAMVHLAPLSSIDVVVSEAGLAEEYQDLLRHKGVDLRLA